MDGKTFKEEGEEERRDIRDGKGIEFVLIRLCGAAITFMAQWHPLIAPESGSLRPEHAT